MKRCSVGEIIIVSKNLAFLLQSESQSEDDFAFGLHAAHFPRLYAGNGQGRNLSFAGKFGFTHQSLFSQLFYKVFCHLLVP
jgi:hypothetical protein